MKAICDTSSIIKLQRGSVIDCLGQLFEVVLIPQAVQQECLKPETKAALLKPFFEVREVSHVLTLSGIHRGEQEAISLAVDQNITLGRAKGGHFAFAAFQQALVEGTHIDNTDAKHMLSS